MQAVKNKDSKIELMLRLALYHKGYRYRENCSTVFGHSDIFLMRTKIAIFCNSEMWHEIVNFQDNTAQKAGQGNCSEFLCGVALGRT